MKLTIVTCTVALFFASCSGPAAEAPKPVDMETLKAEIQKMEDAFSAAEKAKDADGVVAYYAEDAVSYNRNAEPSVGKAAIKDHVVKRFAKDTTGNVSSYKIVDLFAEGNMVVEIGSWTDTSPAGVETKKGYYLSYFQKRDGKYLCVRDMNVSSEPVKAPM